MFRRTWSRFSIEFVFKVVVVLSGWLRRRSREKWLEIVDKGDLRGVSGGTPPLAPSSEIAYSPIKTKYSESLTGSGFPGDTVFKEEISAGTQRRLKLVGDIGGEDVHLPEWAREIQPFLQNQLSVHTRRAYETDLKQFFSFLEGRLDFHKIDTLRPQHIILYRKYLEEGRLSGKPMEKATINRKLAVVKSFFNWLQANQVVKENPARLVKGFPQSQESSLKGLSDDEVRRMLLLPKLNKRSGALHAAILHMLMYMGLRKGELIALRMGDIDEERGTPVLKVRGKGHRVRVLPMKAIVKSALEHYFYVCQRDRTDKEAPVFTPTKNPRTKTMLKPMNPNAITYIVVRYARKAGILKPISPHSCRATCISHALDRRATQRSVQHLAGWTTPLMIQRYDKRREELKNSAAFLVDYEVDIFDEEPKPAPPPETVGNA